MVTGRLESLFYDICFWKHSTSSAYMQHPEIQHHLINDNLLHADNSYWYNCRAAVEALMCHILFLCISHFEMFHKFWIYYSSIHKKIEQKGSFFHIEKAIFWLNYCTNGTQFIDHLYVDNQQHPYRIILLFC